MTEADNMLEGLERYVADLRERATVLERELGEVRAQIRYAEETIKGFATMHEYAHYFRPQEWNCSVEDIQDCKTVREALVRMAELNDGILRVTPAAKLLIDAEFTGGTVVANVTAGIYARIRDRLEWERVGRGEFRFVPYMDSPS